MILPVAFALASEHVLPAQKDQKGCIQVSLTAHVAATWCLLALDVEAPKLLIDHKFAPTGQSRVSMQQACSSSGSFSPSISRNIDTSVCTAHALETSVC